MIPSSPRPWLALAGALAGALAAQEPAVLPAAGLAVVVADAGRSAAERCAALAALQQLGALDVTTALSALASDDEGVGATSAAILRHEWAGFPPALLAGLDGAPVGARRLLHELAVAPRPAARAWIESWMQPAPGRTEDDRCLALAARGQPLVAADGDLLVRTLLAGQAQDGWRAAVDLLPAHVADGLVGKLHGFLAQARLDVEQVAPFLDRLSPGGVRQLLGLVVALPADVARALGNKVAERDLELVRERVCAMLDGEGPIEAIWLDHAGPLLDRPARVDRVLRALVDQAAEPRLRLDAFDALLAARVVAAPVLDFATAEGADPSLVQRLLGVAVAQLPEPQLVAWLDGDPALSTATVNALKRRTDLGPRLEAALLDKLRLADSVEGPFFAAVATALVQHGSAGALAAAWPLVRGDLVWPDLVDALGRRREPFVHELLVAELDAAAPDGMPPEVRAEQLDAVRLALVALGDHRQLAMLVAHAKERPAVFVRRCSHHVRPLQGRWALALLDDAVAAVDAERAAELVAWAATSPEAEVVARLQRLWEAPAGAPFAEELREVAMRSLASGAARAGFVALLGQAMAAGPLPERLESLCFELVSGTPVPLSAADARFLAELALRAPLTDPELERQQRTRWPDGRFGFPLVAAIARQLRGTDPDLLAGAFAGVAAEVMADPRRDAVSRQRLLVLWRSLEADRDVQRAVALPTAGLLLALPDGDGVGEGPAHWFCMQAAADRGDFDAAARHARGAIAGLLRQPDDRRTARLFLGERDPAAGCDPWAALAAAPDLYARRAALARGDAAAAARSAALVREFAGRDAAIRAAIQDSTDRDPLR